MNKPKSGLLTAISVSRIVPRKWTDLYYSALERLDYVNLSTEDQIVCDGIAFSYVELAQAREAMMNPDIREKPDISLIQKRLLNWLSAWRESHKRAPDDGDLAKQLDQFAETNAIDNE